MPNSATARDVRPSSTTPARSWIPTLAARRTISVVSLCSASPRRFTMRASCLHRRSRALRRLWLPFFFPGHVLRQAAHTAQPVRVRRRQARLQNHAARADAVWRGRRGALADRGERGRAETDAGVRVGRRRLALPLELHRQRDGPPPGFQREGRPNHAPPKAWDLQQGHAMAPGQLDVPPDDTDVLPREVERAPRVTPLRHGRPERVRRAAEPLSRRTPAVEGGLGRSQIPKRLPVDAGGIRRAHPRYRAGGRLPADLCEQARQARGRGLRRFRVRAPRLPDGRHACSAVALEPLAARTITVLPLPLGKRPVPSPPRRLRPLLEQPRLGVRRVQPDLVRDHARIIPSRPASARKP